MIVPSSICATYRVCEVVLVDLGHHFGVRERSLENEEVNRKRRGGRGRRFRLQDQLICQLSLVRLMRIALAVIYARLYHKLVVERRKACRLVVELLNILVGAIGLHLQVIENDLLIAEQIDQLAIKLFLLQVLDALGLDSGQHLGAALVRM